MTRPFRPLALALLAGTVLAGPAPAAQDPRAGRFDARVRTVVYNPNNPTRIFATTFTSTQISFAVGETIIAVAIGDSEAWLPQPVGNLLFIKPVEVRAPTNMQIVTRRPDGSTRAYQFELIARHATGTGTAQVASLDGTVPAGGPVAPFVVAFYYPEDARQEAIENRKRAADKAGRESAEARLAVDFFYGPRNWRYAAQGSTAIEPVEVSDNGRLTAFRFPGNTPVPTIYTVAPDGQEAIIPSTLRDDLVLVQTTAREFRLRLGGEVVRIFNLGLDPTGGQDPGTGTTTPEVVRRVREARQ